MCGESGLKLQVLKFLCGVIEDFGLLGCNAMSLAKWFFMF